MYLIDTHALLWFINADEKLPGSIRELMESEKDLYISIGSFWEMAIKSSLGKLTFPGTIRSLIEDCERMGFVVLPIKAAHLERLENMPKIHGDPFDRLLVCQAQEEGLILITKDENIPKYDVETIWD